MTLADRLARIERALTVSMRREATAIREAAAHIEAHEEPDEAYLDELAEAHARANRRTVLLLTVRLQVEQEARDARRAAIPAETIIEAASRARPERSAE